MHGDTNARRSPDADRESVAHRSFQRSHLHGRAGLWRHGLYRGNWRAQHMRDARVLAIYEGTNGIQANDLVFRKLARDEAPRFACCRMKSMSFMPVSAKNPGDDCAGHAQTSHAGHFARCEESGELDCCESQRGCCHGRRQRGTVPAPMGNALGGYYLVKSAALAQEDLVARAGDPDFLERQNHDRALLRRACAAAKRGAGCHHHRRRQSYPCDAGGAVLGNSSFQRNSSVGAVRLRFCGEGLGGHGSLRL